MDLREIKISSKKVFEGHVIDVEVATVRCPDGGESTREVVRRTEASVILPILSNGSILLERQYRYPYDEIIIELPAGKVDKDEHHKDAAFRELKEETGYISHNIKYLGKLYPTVGFCDEVIHMYLALDLEKSEQHLDEHEFVDLFEASLDDVIKMIENGEIVDAKTICAIYKYLLTR